MLYVIRFMVLAAGLAFAPQLAVAQNANCDAVVVDEAKVISDPGKVTTAANALGNQGATVRVRTLTFVGSEGLDKAIEKMCPSSWQVLDAQGKPVMDSEGKPLWKTTMLILAYTPEKHFIGGYYGSSLESRLGHGKWNEILADRLVPQVKAYARGDRGAMTAGLVATMNEMQAQLARPSTGGATTINQAADYGGLWKVLGWMVGAGILMLLVAGGLWLVFRTKADNDETRTARAQARRARSEAVSGILEITDEATLASAGAMIMAAPAEKQSALNLKHARVKSLGSQALDALSAFDDMKGENPNENLTVAAYHSNQQRYEGIISTFIVPAKRLLAEIERGEVDVPKAAPPVEPAPEPYRPPVAPTQPFVPGQAPPTTQRPHFLPDDASAQADREAAQRQADRDAAQRQADRDAEERRRADYAAHGGFGAPPSGWQRGGPWQQPPSGSGASQQPPQPPQPQQPPQVVERVVERDRGGSNDGLLTGIVVGGLLSGDHGGRDRDRYNEGRDDERRRQERDRRYDSDPYESRPRPAEQVTREPVREPDPEPDSGGSFSVAVDDDKEDSGGSFSADSGEARDGGYAGSGDQGGSISVDTDSGSDYGGGSDTSSNDSSSSDNNA